MTRIRLSADTRWKLYRRLSTRPGATSLLRARKYDRLEWLREWIGSRNEKQLLLSMRRGRDVCWLEDEDDDEPLVTVVIPTFRRPDTIMRAIRSALDQTYTNLDVLVVGDATDAKTDEIVRAIPDPRVRFVNLPHRGIYPAGSRDSRSVSGTKPMNVGIDLAAGAWLANCDDDDEMLPHHIETLLADAKRRRLEMVYSRYEVIEPPGLDSTDGSPASRTCGSEPIRFGVVARGAVLYSMGLRFMKYETESWRVRDPADWNLWKRMQLAGARIGFNESVTYRVYSRVGGSPSSR